MSTPTTPTKTKNPLTKAPPTKSVPSTNSVALSADEKAKLEKDCALSSVLAKAAYYGPAPFLHFFLKYMDLTKNNAINYEYNTTSNTWKEMYNLSYNLFRNFTKRIQL